MRRTITILNRFIISTTNWWGNPRIVAQLGGWAFSLLVLLSCHNDLGEVGFKNPNRDFEVIAKEFIIPTRVFLMDSVSTSYGTIVGSTSIATPAPNRFMVGTAEDPVFGKTTAVAYSPVWCTVGGLANQNAVFQSLTLSIALDNYWMGSPDSTGQLFQVYQLTDSIITYKQHYANESVAYGRLLGETIKGIGPAYMEKTILENADNDQENDYTDTLAVDLPDDLGETLLAMAKDTVGTNESNIGRFSKFRKIFKGLAIVSPNSDKLVGFDPSHEKSRMILKYKLDTVEHEIEFLFTPSGQTPSTGEFMAFTQLTTDRSGTPLASLPAKYVDFEPSNGMRYVQAGTGVVTKLDFSEVVDYFKDIPTKALSVAELKIEADEQAKVPQSFKLRVLRADNRDRSTTKQYFDAANDPYADVDAEFYAKHIIYPNTAQRPFFKADVLGDDNEMLLIRKVSDAGEPLKYAGYLTTYMQRELSLDEADFLRYYVLLPQGPDISRGTNGVYFPADKVKLTIYYTIPNQEE